MTAAEHAFIAERVRAAWRKRIAWYATALAWAVLVVALIVGFVVALQHTAPTTFERVVAAGVGLLIVGCLVAIIATRDINTPGQRLAVLRQDHEDRRKEVVWGTLHHKADEGVAYVLWIGNARIEVPQADFAALEEGQHVEVHLSLHSRAVLGIVPRAM